MNSRLLSVTADRPPTWTEHSPARVGGHYGFSTERAEVRDFNRLPRSAVIAIERAM